MSSVVLPPIDLYAERMSLHQYFPLINITAQLLNYTTLRLSRSVCTRVLKRSQAAHTVYNMLPPRLINLPANICPYIATPPNRNNLNEILMANCPNNMWWAPPTVTVHGFETIATHLTALSKTWLSNHKTIERDQDTMKRLIIGLIIH